MKKLHFITCVPDDLRFWWEVAVQLYNFRKFDFSKLCRILVFLPHDRLSQGFNPKWKELQALFPESQFFFYQDHKDYRSSVYHLMNAFDYIPILRPSMMVDHFKEFQELKDDVIFYHDSDIIFTKPFDFTPYLSDDINYLSDTKSYLNSEYFDNKVHDVLPHKLAEYQKRDILNETAKICGIDRSICELNKDVTGGAQYILKNIDSSFWVDVFNNCLEIRLHLKGVNQLYFENENKGFQGWCADMWAVLWNLWKRGGKTETPKELSFAWSTDEVSVLKEKNILHNAGITSSGKITRREDKKVIECPAFFKGAYHDNSKTPFDDAILLESIITHPGSSHYCNSVYVQEILEAKYNLNL